jgi:Carboxypeptidase regulatory-like domain/TonB dependent receptor
MRAFRFLPLAACVAALRVRILLAALLSALAVCSAAYGQSVNYTTGSIAGKVSDNTGTGVPGVTVTATNLETGLTRTAYSDKDGGYDLGLLPPGPYSVSAELTGLGKASVPRTTVLLGNTTKTDLKLAISIAEAVTVSAAAPVIDPRATGISEAVTSQEIRSLPLLGRDFRSLAQLTPGVSVGSFDTTAITANGARPLSTDYNIDGASSNNDFFGQQTGGSRPPFTFSQAAIQEFQVVRTEYDAEYGRGVGLVVNAITKSGTNGFHGEAFYYDRRASLAATRTTTFNTDFGGTTYPLPISDSFLSKDVKQPGAFIGGPIVRDKLFFFGGYDSMTQSQPAVIGNDMRASAQFLALTPAQQQTALSKIQTAVGAPYEAGLNYSVDNDLKTYLLKFDGNLSPQYHWSLRGNITNYDTTNSGATSSFGLNQTNEVDKFYQVVGEVDAIFTDKLSNQFFAQVGRDQRPVTSQFGGTEFSINFGQTQFFGANDTTPNTADEKKFQFKDTVQYDWNGHSLKAGAELLHRPLFDSFPRFAGGLYAYSSLLNYVNDRPNTFQQAYGPQNGDVNWTTNQWGFYLNDDFRIAPRLTLNLGLRYDYLPTPVPPSNAFPQHPEFLTQIKNDTNNVAPRLGFAWDIFGNGRSVLRGGTGVFYEYMPDILLASPIQGISGALITTTFTCTTTPTNPCPAYPNILAPADFLAKSQLSANLVTIGPDYQAQQAWRSSLQFEQNLFSDLVVGASAVYSKLTHIQGTRNINLVPTGYSLGNMPVYDYSSSTNPARPYADLGIVRELSSNESAWYRGQTIEFRKRPTADSRLSWLISYTHSDSVDDETNTRSTSTTFLIDPNNPSLSEGPSDNDVKHRVTASAIYRLPWGLELSGVGFWHSGYPYTGAISFTCSGCPANSLTGQAQTSQAANFTPVFVDGHGNIIDLTQANGMTLPQFSAFLASQNAQLIQRNSFRQPSVWDFDLRLSKTFDLPYNIQLTILGEIFNVFNRNAAVVTGANQDQFRITYTASTGKYAITKFTNTVNGTALNTFGVVQGYSSETIPRTLQFAARISF